MGNDMLDVPEDAGNQAPPESLDTFLLRTAYEALVEKGEEPTPERLGEIIGKMLPEVIPGVAKLSAEQILAAAPAALQEQRAERARFEGVLRSAWGETLDLLEVLSPYFISMAGTTSLTRSKPVPPIGERRPWVGSTRGQYAPPTRFCACWNRGLQMGRSPGVGACTSWRWWPSF